ncbi:hypothetical protein P5W04_10385 [Mycobacteroides abscessus subsp. abscessus]|uniref:hypothetical protein n=1 Tax=Mycobacteroides abscessus TaxID=36809 RepID=UPI0011C48714|nr:hypothetical protein [Mycobacteroides abscessus]MBN7484536.1 hypothetical protein [Mycobacteroides abscessus subsp. abscessus]MDO3240522.1 hypothetical protein [Mycobacteroides abscessus subsp. abscessus]
MTVLADLRGWVLARVDGVPPTEVLLHSRMWEVDDWMTVTVADYLQWMKNISDGIARNSFHPFTIERRDGDRVVTDEVPAQDILDVLRAGTAGWVRGLDASAFEGLSMTEAVDLNLIASRYGVDLV